MTQIVDIEGIGPVYAEKLKACGIDTTDELLEHCGSASGRNKFAGDTGLEASQLLEWVNRADLMRIKGVGEEYSDLLEASGVDTVKELATRNAENLHAKMVEVNEDKALVRSLPSEDAVSEWVEEAGTLDPMVSH